MPHDCTLQKYRKTPIFHIAIASNSQHIPLYTCLMHAQFANFLRDFASSMAMEVRGQNGQQIVNGPPVLQVPPETNRSAGDVQAPELCYYIAAGVCNLLLNYLHVYMAGLKQADCLQKSSSIPQYRHTLVYARRLLLTRELLLELPDQCRRLLLLLCLL